MENDYFSLNTTLNTSNSLLEEFPFWRECLSTSLLGSFLLSSYIIILHLFLLIVLFKIKKEHFKPLNLMHISLLVSTIVEDVLRIVFDVLYLPSLYRFCFCSLFTGTIYGLQMIFFAIHRPFTFACLGVLQLLVIIGKKKFVNAKIACGMIAFCIGLSLIFVASVVKVLIDTNERPFCFESFCPDSRPESSSIFGVLTTVFLAMIVCSFLPSLVVLFITSTWSCAVFKHYYTGGDDQLNRRILSLPIIMPLALIASTMLESIIALVSTEILLMFSLGEYLPYWIGFSQSLVNVLFRVISRSAYPVLLIYTHSHIREAVKKLLKRVKATNRVAPGSE